MNGLMKGGVWLIAALLLLPAACAPPAAESRTGEDVRDVDAEVRAYLTEYNGAFASADTARIRALYVADDRLAWIEDGVVKYRSVNDIFASLAALTPGASIETQLSDVSIVPLAGNAATVRALFTTMFNTGDGSGFSFGGALSMVLEHDGSHWRAVSGHTSTAGDSWDSR